MVCFVCTVFSVICTDGDGKNRNHLSYFNLIYLFIYLFILRQTFFFQYSVDLFPNLPSEFGLFLEFLIFLIGYFLGAFLSPPFSRSSFHIPLMSSSFCFQDRLSFIGPEEFIQTFAMKDPLENHKVKLLKTKLFIDQIDVYKNSCLCFPAATRLVSNDQSQRNDIKSCLI